MKGMLGSSRGFEHWQAFPLSLKLLLLLHVVEGSARLVFAGEANIPRR